MFKEHSGKTEGQYAWSLAGNGYSFYWNDALSDMDALNKVVVVNFGKSRYIREKNEGFPFDENVLSSF